MAPTAFTRPAYPEDLDTAHLMLQLNQLRNANSTADFDRAVEFELSAVATDK